MSTRAAPQATKKDFPATSAFDTIALAWNAGEECKAIKNPGPQEKRLHLLYFLIQYLGQL
jgi:hypothetical protein